MTEALPLPTQYAAEQRPSLQLSELSVPRQIDTPATLITEETAAEDDDGIIACICDYTSDDGSTIQCDKCLRWQHISCYYPPPKKVPDDDQKHYCVDCVPQPELDPRKAAERQRRALDPHSGSNVAKRPATKSNKKKVKDSPSLTAQTNGWSDRHPHIHNHDRKSASPRDQPPPAKKPKISHRSSNSINAGRRRAGTSNAAPARSPSKSPEIDTSAYIPQYSDEFLHLFKGQDDQIEMSTNLMDGLSLTAQLSDWVTDPDALSKATGGLAPSEVFKRWDGRMEDIPGRPQVTLHYVEDTSFQANGATPTWAQLIIEDSIATGTFIGELRGRIGNKQDYVHDAESRWSLLNHPEPCVFFHPQLPICIDARQEGTRFRYVRRSCSPNAELQTIITEGTEYHFCFMATRDIQAGEEVTVAWQVPDSIRERINSSLKTSNNFQPKVREYISTWVSHVLSNCGPCACNSQNACLMAHYDRRGRPPPSPTTKPIKRKKRAAVLDSGIADRSRSASEVRKTDVDDDISVSRSASGSQASASRDITPHINHTAGTSNKAMPEISERERKKLMRTEELFRRQEAESGKLKKKRNSSSTIETLGTNISRTQPLPNGYPTRYVDASTTVNGRLDSSSSRAAGTKRKAGSNARSSRTDGKQSVSPNNYIDIGIQCDLEASVELATVRSRPPRRYVSITKRLLERCIYNNLGKRAPESPVMPAPPNTESDVMDVDHKSHPGSSRSSLSNARPANEAHINGTEEVPGLPAVKSEGDDTPMVNADPIATVKTESPDPRAQQKSPALPARSSPDHGECFQPVQAPSVLESLTPLASHDMLAADPIPHPRLSSGPNHRPVMHLDMPPPPSSLAFDAAATAAFASQNSNQTVTGSKLTATPGLLQAQDPLTIFTPLAMFSPSVTASVLMSPSPVRKKMSLSDYTKRSKAARESGGGGGSATDGIVTPLATPATGVTGVSPWDDKASGTAEEDVSKSGTGSFSTTTSDVAVSAPAVVTENDPAPTAASEVDTPVTAAVSAAAPDSVVKVDGAVSDSRQDTAYPMQTTAVQAEDGDDSRGATAAEANGP